MNGLEEVGQISDAITLSNKTNWYLSFRERRKHLLQYHRLCVTVSIRVNQPIFFSLFSIHLTLACTSRDKLIIWGLCTCALLSEAEPAQLPTAERSHFNGGKPPLGMRSAWHWYRSVSIISEWERIQTHCADSTLKSSLKSACFPLYLASPAGISEAAWLESPDSAEHLPQ